MKSLYRIDDTNVRRQVEHMVGEFNRANQLPVYGQQSFTNPGSTGQVLIQFSVTEEAGVLMVFTIAAQVSSGATSGVYGFTSPIGDAKTDVNSTYGVGSVTLHRAIKYQKGSHQVLLTTAAAGNCSMVIDYTVTPYIVAS